MKERKEKKKYKKVRRFLRFFRFFNFEINAPVVVGAYGLCREGRKKILLSLYIYI